jgi:hypothetical protein
MTTPTTTTTPPPLDQTIDLDRARHVVVTLGPGDADAFLVAESLLGHRRGEGFEQPPSTSSPSPALGLALARLSAVGLQRFLLARGSERPARVLRTRGERIVVVDGALSLNDDDGGDGAFDLRCGARWANGVFRIARDLMPLMERRRGGVERSLSGLGRTERQRLRELFVGDETTAMGTGDHVAFACAHEHVGRLLLPGAFEVFLGRALAQASPFAHLHRLDDPECGALDVAALVRPPLVRLVELCGPGLSTTWREGLRRIVQHAADVDEVVARGRHFARQLEAFVRGLDGAARLDLLEGVVAFIVALPTVLPPDTRARLVRLPGVTTMADRDRVVTAVGAVFAVLDVVDEVGRALAATRFGDERFVEARLVAGLLEPLRRERTAVDAARRALTGVVG